MKFQENLFKLPSDFPVYPIARDWQFEHRRKSYDIQMFLMGVERELQLLRDYLSLGIDANENPSPTETENRQ